MASLYQDIRGALQSRLIATVGLPAVAFEGVPFKPTRGTPFVEAMMIMGSARPHTLGSTPLVFHEGEFIANCVFPSGSGTGDAEAMADAIKLQFTAGLSLTVGSTSIRIKYAERRSVLIDSDWIRVPVIVGWATFSTTN